MGGGKNKSKKNNTKKRRKQPATTKTATTETTYNQRKQREHAVFQRSNFYPGAGPGCYIARRDLGSGNTTSTSTTTTNDWILEWEDVSPDDFDHPMSDIPELAMDPDEKTLSVCNTRDSTTIVAYISVLDTPVLGRNKQRLPQGKTTDNEGKTRDCVTFIVLCPPLVFCHLCFLDVSDEVDIFRDVALESDVQEWNRHPKPDDEHFYPLGFPLDTSTTTPSFLCTQGEGGQLTHFFSGNLHAIDFRCPIGTPLLAVGNGTVVETKDNNTLTGIAVSNLFEWNTIMLQLDVDNNDDNDNDNNSLFVEYVHIQKSLVKQGDRVVKGQVIGESGSVGFSPEPHLHFAAYRSQDPTAPTVRVRFQSTTTNEDDGKPVLFLPEAGKYYNAQGETIAR